VDAGQLSLYAGAGAWLLGFILRLAERTDHVAHVCDVGNGTGGRLVVAGQAVLAYDHHAAEYHYADADHGYGQQGAVPGALPETLARHLVSEDANEMQL